MTREKNDFISKIGIVFMFLGFTLLFGADNPMDFLTNAFENVYSTYFTKIVTFIIIVTGMLMIFFQNANWMTVTFLCFAISLGLFVAPRLIKMISDYSSSWNPQSGVILSHIEPFSAYLLS